MDIVSTVPCIMDNFLMIVCLTPLLLHHVNSENDISHSKTATQSYTYGNNMNYAASKAVDGDVSTCSFTAVDNGPRDTNGWWQLDLGDVFSVTNVTITNTDTMDFTAYQYLTAFVIFVGATNKTDDPSDVNSICFAADALTGSSGQQISFSCQNQPLRGRYLTVRKHSGTNLRLDALTLCEVVVYGFLGEATTTTSTTSTTKPTPTVTTKSSSTSNPITLLSQPSSSFQGSSQSTTTSFQPLSSISTVSSNVSWSNADSFPQVTESHREAIIIGVIVGLVIFIALVITVVMVIRRCSKLDTVSKNHQENVPHVACPNDPQSDHSQYMSLNGATLDDQKSDTMNLTYENVSTPEEGQQSTYTALDFNNIHYMSLNGVTRADKDTAAMNPAYDNVSHPGEGEQSTYTALDFNPPDNNLYQAISESDQDKKGHLKVSRVIGFEDTSKHRPVQDGVVNFQNIDYEELSEFQKNAA